MSSLVNRKTRAGRLDTKAAILMHGETRYKIEGGDLIPILLTESSRCSGLEHISPIREARGLTEPFVLGTTRVIDEVGLVEGGVIYPKSRLVTGAPHRFQPAFTEVCLPADWLEGISQPYRLS